MYIRDFVSSSRVNFLEEGAAPRYFNELIAVLAYCIVNCYSR